MRGSAPRPGDAHAGAEARSPCRARRFVPPARAAAARLRSADRRLRIGLGTRAQVLKDHRDPRDRAGRASRVRWRCTRRRHGERDGPRRRCGRRGRDTHHRVEDVTDLPEPDSPTMPTILPFGGPRCRCARPHAPGIPAQVANSTVRVLAFQERHRIGDHFVSATMTSGAPLRIDDVAQAVAEQFEAEHRQHQCGARKKGDPPFARNDVAGAFRHQNAPLRRQRRRPRPMNDRPAALRMA